MGNHWHFVLWPNEAYVDASNVKWDKRKKRLSGISKVVKGDTYMLVIARNNFKVSGAAVDSGKVTITDTGNGLSQLHITPHATGEAKWDIRFDN